VNREHDTPSRAKKQKSEGQKGTKGTRTTTLAGPQGSNILEREGKTT